MKPELPVYSRLCTISPKNMVSSCCLKVISMLLESNGAEIKHIKPGEVNFYYDPLVHSETFYADLLTANGFEPVAGRDGQLVEQIKLAVYELVHKAGNVNSIIRNSDYLVERLGFSYAHLSNIFSRYENLTLERFIILHKIEKVKELIEYGELTLSEIAIQLGYSSVQYLSNQFKQITGESVSNYKKGSNSRLPIEQIGK